MTAKKTTDKASKTASKKVVKPTGAKATPKKTTGANAAPKKSKAPKSVQKPTSGAPFIRRIRVSCVDGPWYDGEECVRFIDLPGTANLYDLHIAIQDAVAFDDEHPFYFFLAEGVDADRIPVPDSLPSFPEKSDIDDDLYEDIMALDSIPERGVELLHYSFLSDGGEWVFEIRIAGEAAAPQPGIFYPAVAESLSVGPNPEQYGSGFDDYAEDDEEFRPLPRGARGSNSFEDDEDDDSSTWGDDDQFGDDGDDWGEDNDEDW